MQDVRIGWVGVRGYGQRFYSAISGPKLCKVTACLHLDKNVALQAAQRMKCKAFSNIDEFFALDTIDAVVLTVPNEFHYDYTRRALENGKHVLVEKPLTNSYAQAKKLVSLAKEKSLVLMVGHNYKKSNFIIKIKEQIEKGRIGKLVAAEFNMGHGGGLKFGPEKWRFHKEKCPGGPLNMLGTHLIDASNWLFGKAIKVTGAVKKLHANTTAQDMSLIQLEYENGVVVNITNLYNSVSTEFINIYGTEGALRFSRWPQAGLWFQPKDVNCDCAPYEEIDFENNNTALEIFEEFIKAVRDGNLNSNAKESAEVVRIMEEALK